MKPAQKSDFTQLQLEQRQKPLSWQICFDYFPLIVTHIQNILCPQEHLLWYLIVEILLINRKSSFCALNYLWVTTLSPRVLKSYSDWSKCSDPFLGHLIFKLVPVKYEMSFVLCHIKSDGKCFWKPNIHKMFRKLSPDTIHNFFHLPVLIEKSFFYGTWLIIFTVQC